VSRPVRTLRSEQWMDKGNMTGRQDDALCDELVSKSVYRGCYDALQFIGFWCVRAWRVCAALRTRYQAFK
jgi:hypothetical protein